MRPSLGEILEPGLFDLKRRVPQPRRPHGRAPQPAPPDWKCLHQQQSGWIPLDDPKFVFKAMVPGKTRLDNAMFSTLQAQDVNIGAIGQDEREPWTNTLDAPYRWICKLSVVFQSRNGGDLHFSEASGILIGNRHVLTAAHALFDSVFTNATHVDTREARAVIVIPGLNGIHSAPDRLMPFGWSWGSAFRTTDDARDVSCRFGHLLTGADFAVVKLVDDLGNRFYPALSGARFGHWGHKDLGANTLMKFKKSNSIRGVSVNVMGYPADRCRDRPLGRAITQQELNNCSPSDNASVPWLSTERIVDPGPDGLLFGEMQVEHDFAPGMSGGPVWIRWKGFRNMLGLALAVPRNNPRTNVAVRFTETALNEISSWID
jgi:V8-like Glu-specific endopeptidase